MTTTHKDPQPTIVGAGLAGLIAAYAWPAAPVLEAAPQPVSAHKALLRFRTDAVARLTGVDFRRVTVRKGIWTERGFALPSIALCNQYAHKVTGALGGERSIWNLDTVERWVAPEDLHERLLEGVGARVTWDAPAPFRLFNAASPAVSTAPLPVALRELGYDTADLSSDLRMAPIRVERWVLPNTDVFQTVYYPSSATPLYRASITGNLLIAESVVGSPWTVATSPFLLEESFGLPPRFLEDCEQLPAVDQKYGKIQPLPSAQRKELLFRLTHDHGIYSLGRFATWRNALLDDIVQDTQQIRQLMRTSSAYELRKASA